MRLSWSRRRHHQRRFRHDDKREREMLVLIEEERGKIKGCVFLFGPFFLQEKMVIKKERRSKQATARVDKEMLG